LLNFNGPVLSVPAAGQIHRTGVAPQLQNSLPTCAGRELRPRAFSRREMDCRVKARQ
jgi:hypothetical protein